MLAIHAIWKGVFGFGVITTPAGAISLLIERALGEPKHFRDGQWRQTILTLGPSDALWLIAKPFLFGGLLCFFRWPIGAADNEIRRRPNPDRSGAASLVDEMSLLGVLSQEVGSDPRLLLVRQIHS